MLRSSRFLGLLMLLTTLAFVWPGETFAQRAVPRSASRGGGARVGVAVPRGSYHGAYRPYPYRYYAYPRYYYSYPHYAPFSWGIGFGIGFGIGWSGGGWGYPYGYSYPYPYPYAPSPYRYYYRPYWSGYYEPAARLTVTPRAAQPYANASEQRRPASSPATGRAGGFTALSLRVIPGDATVLIDGEVLDRPLQDNRFSIDLAEGSHLIEIRKEGYGSYSRRVDAERGQPLTLNVGLTRRGFVPAYGSTHAAGATLVRR